MTVAGAGCKKATPKTKIAEKEEASDDKAVHLNVGPGQGHFRTETAKREPLWDVQWQKGDVITKDQGVTGGMLRNVTGQLYNHSRPGTKFKGDEAKAFQLAQTLTLIGNVKMTSLDPAVTLTCDRVFYDAKRKVIKAFGNVKVTSRMGTIGTLTELWTTPDLKVVATPNLF